MDARGHHQLHGAKARLHSRVAGLSALRRCPGGHVQQRAEELPAVCDRLLVSTAWFAALFSTELFCCIVLSTLPLYSQTYTYGSDFGSSRLGHYLIRKKSVICGEAEVL